MVAPYIARLTPQLLSIECWGGATYDVALRFLKEDPWERLAALREAVPNICLQMLLRGRNTVGLHARIRRPVTQAFVEEATGTGIDIYRIFDALNNVESMRPAIDAVRETGTAVAEVAMSYTGDLSDPAENLYTLDYYLKLAEQIVDAGAHVLAIKDMAGLLRPPAASDVGQRAAQPVRPAGARAHPRHPGRSAGHLPGGLAGRGRRGRRRRRAAGGHHQPARAVVDRRRRRAHRVRHRAVAGGGVRSGAVLGGAAKGVRAVRVRVCPPRPAGSTPTRSRAASCRTCASRPSRWGFGDRFEEIETNYAAADRMLGRLVKVTPSSKVVGDLALALVGAGVSADEFAADPARFDIPDSVIGFLRGELGDPPGGWPEPLRTKALRAARRPSPQQELTAEDEAALTQPGPERQATLNRLLFPGPTKEFEAHREQYGDTSRLSANQFFYGLRHGEEHRVQLERGVELLIGLEAISDPDERGMRTVMCIINGQLRPVLVRDRSIASNVPTAEKADRTNPDHIAAPFAGVVTVAVAEGDEVTAGQTIATIEAMKMEAAITAPKAGTVQPRRGVGDRAGGGRRPADGGQLTRIIAGSAGGRRIAVPPSGTRPTTRPGARGAVQRAGRARWTSPGLAVLDLYAGSGALGLEALSRGAAHGDVRRVRRRARPR